MKWLNELFSALVVFSTWGCGPHHVSTIQVTITKYQCVNWIQTVAMCDTLDECNKVCKDAAAGVK